MFCVSSAKRVFSLSLSSTYKEKTPMRVCAHGGYLRSIVHILTCVSGLFRAETSLSSFFFVVVFLAACKVLAILRQLFWEAKCLD